MRNAVMAGFISLLVALPAAALSLAPEEFNASRQLACVLAEQSLGYLTEVEYGARTHDVLDGFDDTERDNILAKAIGYVDGLMFDIAADNNNLVDGRLQEFVASTTCASEGYQNATLRL
ncbi:hypothetical protein [Haliea sp. E17]|uniref:hypothetical protein n=1 Tax=Haliea sp. E17 TaxID=3401576 RepID=UPI003AB08144